VTAQNRNTLYEKWILAELVWYDELRIRNDTSKWLFDRR